ncbi:hypothetical protein GCM10009844_05180 [Nocardioides koreensis]|uniref:STAS domain-containing protein n=1 Tax=Nocardioides koreensis TaxID=433651 RepID=A0ABN2Z771_9ACTN
MPDPRRILTVHSPVPPQVLDHLLSAVEGALRRAGAGRVWIDCHYAPDLVVMAELAATEPAGAAGSDVTAVIPQPR